MYIREPGNNGRKENPKTQDFRHRFYSSTTKQQWNDWRWQVQNRITTFDQLGRLFCLSGDEKKALTGTRHLLPVAVTPYYASLLDKTDSRHPIRRTVIPSTREHSFSQGEANDPLGRR